MTNEEIIRQYLNNKGLTAAGVAGLMGNLAVESGLRSDNLQNSYERKLGLSDTEYTQAVDSGAYTADKFIHDSAGYGLAQWTYWSRKKALYEYIKLAGLSIGDLNGQLDYLYWELENKYGTVLNTLKTSNSVDECGRAVMLGFERPANQSEENIQRRIEICYRYYEEGDSVNKLKICIDAGHYLGTAGKRCLKSLDPNETREWVLNDRIADKLERLLSGYECEVLRVDDTTGAKDISLASRVNASNNWGSDVYISIHHNAGINGGTGGGTVAYWYSNKAERETQCKALYDAVVSQTKLVGNRSVKVKKTNYYVLANTKAPAFLLENGFMDSSTDVPIILSEDHANKTAVGLLQWLINTWGLKAKPDVGGNAVNKSLYRVQCGAFSSRANAELLQAKLKADGYEAVIV